MLVGTSDGAAKATATTSKATATTSLTRAQKLTKALKACKKLPTKKKRAACVKLAKKKYGPQHAVTPATAPTGSSAAPTGGATTPTAPVTPPTGAITPLTGGAPPGPTQEWLQHEVERVEAGVVKHGKQVSYVTILARGTPHLGSGVALEYGGDGALPTEWVYPLEYSYEVTYPIEQLIPGTAEFEVLYIEAEHWQTEANVFFSTLGHFVLHTHHTTCSSTPTPGFCH
jgi:hypothetical protein